MNDTTGFAHPALDGVLRTASRLTGMEVVLVAAPEGDQVVAQRVHLVGDWPGVADGLSAPADDALCARLLAGATSGMTADAAHDPVYAHSPLVHTFGVQSYVGVPVLDGQGRVLATLCGVDRGQVAVTEATVEVLRELASAVAAVVLPTTTEAPLPEAAPAAPHPDGLVVRRLAGGGWQVCDPARPQGTDPEVTADLLSAMVLADLLADDLAPAGRPGRPDPALDELGRLRLAVGQLEHALAARVVVEQALGVLSERQRHSPREAFERLRKVARSRGRKVHDLAREVVLSAQDPAVPLPPELAGRR